MYHYVTYVYCTRKTLTFEAIYTAAIHSYRTIVLARACKASEHAPCETGSIGAHKCGVLRLGSASTGSIDV